MSDYKEKEETLVVENTEEAINQTLTEVILAVAPEKEITTLHYSDLHMDFPEFPRSATILFIHGDTCIYGNEREMKSFCDWLLLHHENWENICLTFGNHDMLAQSDEKKTREIFKELTDMGKLHILINQTITLYGLKIFMSPYSKKWGEYAFQDSDENLYHLAWKFIEEDSNIVICHSPFYGSLDYVKNISGHEKDHHIGSKTLLTKLMNCPSLKLFGCGHIHESYGVDEGRFLAINSAMTTHGWKKREGIKVTWFAKEILFWEIF